MRRRCILGLIAGAIVGTITGLGVGTALANYLMPGGPSTTGIALILGFWVFGMTGGTIGGGVQACGRRT